RGRLAHVIGVRLEGEAQHRDGLALQRAAAGRNNLARHRRFTLAINVDRRLDDAQRHAVTLADRGERLSVLREARSTEAWPGMQELPGDTAVEPHAAGDLLHVDA